MNTVQYACKGGGGGGGGGVGGGGGGTDIMENMPDIAIKNSKGKNMW